MGNLGSSLVMDSSSTFLVIRSSYWYGGSMALVSLLVALVEVLPDHKKEPGKEDEGDIYRVPFPPLGACIRQNGKLEKG